MSRLLAALAIAAGLAGPGVAQETGAEPAAPAPEQGFGVTFSYAGFDERYSDPLVPLLPSNACYSWYARLPEGATAETVVERLVLPVPLADWGTLATNPDDNIEISDDGATATTTLPAEPDADRWLSNTWCVAAGDPVGPHRFEIEVDGAPLTTIAFDVVAPEDYNWPAITQPDPMARGVYNSW